MFLFFSCVGKETHVGFLGWLNSQISILTIYNLGRHLASLILVYEDIRLQVYHCMKQLAQSGRSDVFNTIQHNNATHSNWYFKISLSIILILKSIKIRRANTIHVLTHTSVIIESAKLIHWCHSSVGLGIPF